MEFNGVSGEYLSRYKRIAICAVFLGVVGLPTLLYSFYLFNQSMMPVINVGMILGLIMTMVNAFVIPEAFIRRGIAASIGKELKVTVGSEGVAIKDRIDDKEIVKHFAWGDIDAIKIHDRPSLFAVISRNYPKVITVTVNVRKLADFVNKHAKDKRISQYRDELLDCYFELEYRHELIREIERYWNSPIEHVGLIN